jgi:anthranilate/para-aminobenzoate synthase component I
MEIIDDIENEPRGLSMGAIGYFVPDTGFDLNPGFDLSVAIRTKVVRDSVAEFNVGGGVVSDSEAEAEYEESLLKAKALLAALGADFSG